jgi:hypothetical protein
VAEFSRSDRPVLTAELSRTAATIADLHFVNPSARWRSCLVGLAVVLVGGSGAACSVERLPAPPPSAGASASPVVAPTPAPTPLQATPAPEARASDPPLPEPPYRLDDGGPWAQSPGTIVFGLWSNLGLQTYTGFPAGFGIDQDLGFGAYFGRPVGTSSVTITLFELKNDGWREVWSLEGRSASARSEVDRHRSSRPR